MLKGLGREKGIYGIGLEGDIIKEEGRRETPLFRLEVFLSSSWKNM